MSGRQVSPTGTEGPVRDMTHCVGTPQQRARILCAVALRLAAPYVAVGIFLCVLHNAWLALLAYHAQILAWRRVVRPELARPRPSAALLFALPSALAGPVLYLLLPHITRTDVVGWLARHHLSGAALLLMIPYFGLVHPVLEQIHWGSLRERTVLAHAAFAGYHLLVLGSLLTVPWLAACFAVLLAASLLWERMGRRSGSVWPAIASQIAADLGVVLAAWLSAGRFR